MAFPLVLISSANEKSSQGAKTAATILAGVYFVLFVLAMYLAVRDMEFLPHTSTKIWVLVLAFFLPDLYVILHGISSSAQGVSFFAGSPMPGGMGGASVMPSGMGGLSPTLSPTGLSPESSLGLA
jgi:hypothetical protein